MKTKDGEPLGVDEQQFFEEFTRLTGRDVEVGLRSIDKVLRGRVVNSMFDSFLLATDQGNRVIRFGDISFLTRL